MEELKELIPFVPEQYKGKVMALIAVSPFVTRAIYSLINGRGLRGIFSAIWLGTNAPKQVEAVKNPLPPATVSLLIGALMLTSLATGCGTTPLNVATKSDGVVIITVDGAMKGWRDYVVARKATQAQIDQVHDAYIKYYNAQKIAEQALLEYSALTADEQVSQSAKVQYLATAATAASEPLINLIQLFINKKVGL